MNLTLQRRASVDGWTLGELAIDGRFECWTCEDIVRAPGEAKVPGATAIPAGRYQVIVSPSPRFSALARREVKLPLLVGVPGFEGVRIHPGNTAAETEGCILPGRSYNPRGVVQSQGAFDSLMAHIETALANAELVWIEISNHGERPPAPAPKSATAAARAPDLRTAAPAAQRDTGIG